MRSEPVEMLFLHPLPFDGEVWAPLEAAVRDVATHAPTIYSLAENLQDVAHAVLDVVEGKRLIVVGNSIGGSCALEVAAAAPDRVEHLVLIGTKAGHRPEPHLRDWALELLASQGVEAVWEHTWEPLFSASTDRAVVAEARSLALTMPADLLAAGIARFHGRLDRNAVIDGWSNPSRSSPAPMTLLRGLTFSKRWPGGPSAVSSGSCLTAATTSRSNGLARWLRSSTKWSVARCGRRSRVRRKCSSAWVPGRCQCGRGRSGLSSRVSA